MLDGASKTYTTPVAVQRLAIGVSRTLNPTARISIGSIEAVLFNPCPFPSS
jgi:hypothetical protein